MLSIVLVLLCGCADTSNITNTNNEIESTENASEVNLTEQENDDTSEQLNVTEEQKSYYGEWEVNELFFSDAPSIWGRKELESYVGKQLVLSSKKVVFDDVELINPFYGERILSSKELAEELVTTYEALGLSHENLPSLVTIYSGKNMDESEEWISESVIYRFFVKDENTIIAENRNAYFVLIRVSN